MKKDKEYIVTEKQISNALVSALKKMFGDSECGKAVRDTILEKCMWGISIVLEDDCDEMTDEMWGMMMV